MPLVWPGSDNRDEKKDPNEFVFRDGTRTIAPYLAVLMGALDTERYTFDEAIKAVNNGLMSDHLTQAQDRTVQGHFRRWGS